MSASGQIVFTAASANEWGAAIANAREFLAAAAKMIGNGRELCLTKGTLLYDMYQSLCPRAILLVELGKKLGGPVHGLILTTHTHDVPRIEPVAPAPMQPALRTGRPFEGMER